MPDDLTVEHMGSYNGGAYDDIFTPVSALRQTSDDLRV